jgi:hypothetical protein
MDPSVQISKGSICVLHIKKKRRWHPQLTPIIPATQEAEIRRMMV